MMKVLMLFTVVFFSVGLWAQTQVLVIKTDIHCDHCAQCGDCKPKIENALLFAKGVKNAVFSVEEETITVTYNAKKTDPASLRQALASAGFPADEIPADPEAHAQLDACCQKKP